MRLLIAGVIVLAAVASQPPASACHPVQLNEVDLGPVTLTYWIDFGCPHAFPRPCVIIAAEGGDPLGPICV